MPDKKNKPAEKKLRGKVADLLSEYRVILNIGSGSGVKEGMIFRILGEKNIIDPDTSLDLGKYRYAKVKVKIINVQDNYSVASSRFSASWTSLSWWAASSTATTAYPTVTSREGTKPADITIDRNVKTGDVALQE